MTLAHNHNKSPAPVSVGGVSETAKKSKAHALVAKGGDAATKASIANGETFTGSRGGIHNLRNLQAKTIVHYDDFAVSNQFTVN